LRARFHVVVDAFADAQLGEPLLLKLQGQLEPFDDVECFQELQLLANVQIGRIAGGIRQGAWLRNRADERADATVVATKLENLRDHRAIFALELAGESRRRRDVGTFLDFDAQNAVRIGVRRTRHASVERRE
jgi:hypothetical protein